MPGEPILTVAAVNELMIACLADGYEGEQVVDVGGVVNNYRFNVAQIAANRDRIGQLLLELPWSFRETEEHGGGWTFANACIDSEDRHWGEHVHMEALVCLGIAAGYASWQFPREQWEDLPGGLPYFTIHNRSIGATANDVQG